MSMRWQDEFNTAYLPGVGFIVDPQPADYRKAIRFLRHKGFPVRRGRWSFLTSQHSLLYRLEATARRLEWKPKRLSGMGENAPGTNADNGAQLAVACWHGERTTPESVP
jgi:hypothetical protein